jgi:hypothetical protein
MRITASWVWVFAPTEYKDVARTSCTTPELPSELRHPDHSKCAAVLGAFKAKPVGGRQTAASLDRSCARRQGEA